jgi:acylphosphatase
MTGKTQNNKMADVSHLSATVYGRVQGVLFRYFVRNEAMELGLAGYVRNLASGHAVEVQAEGERRQLNKLLGRLKVGPPGARVERMEVKWVDYSGQFGDFSIRY